MKTMFFNKEIFIKKYHFFIIVLFCFIFSSKAQQNDSNANLPQLSNEEIRDSIFTLLKSTRTPNAFITVVKKDSVLFDLDFPNSSENEKFALGSISKTFTALAILKLVDEKKLSLEDHLNEIAPEIDFDNKWESTHPVKIKHLLTHRSGFDDIHISSLIQKRNLKMNASDEVKTFKNSYVSNWQPGLVHSYSNPGYVILGYIIEKISGISYQEFIKNEILIPLEMHNSDYLSRINTSEIIQGFQIRKNVVENVSNPKMIGESAGGLVSTQRDMAKFLQFFINKSKQDSLNIISSSLIAKMQTLQSEFEIFNNINSGYSLGMYDRYFGADKSNFKGHNGSIDGFSSDFIFNPELNLGIAVSRNLFQTSNSKILNLLVDNFAKYDTLIESNQKDLETKLINIDEWAGSYKMLNGNNELIHFINAPAHILKLTKSGQNILVKRFLGNTEVYEWVKENHFQDKHGRSIFLCEFDGEKILSLNEDTLVKTTPFFHYSNLFFLALSLITGIFLTIVFLIQLVSIFFNTKAKKLSYLTFLVILPFWLIVASVILYLSNSTYHDLDNLGNISLTSAAIFTFTLFYPLVLVLGGFSLFKKWGTLKKSIIKIGYIITFFSISYLVFYCVTYGWFAIRLWNY
ncbi:serine hydrolase domain-containing protein [Mesoflavibacter sp. CH_XMU1404-2]|uniref:serine hydrolase domain-containing protein n=1 Tax=Mesoflavibacter sp. CH_XMU1404-2 TaxID=3107766 RepID=UPI00300AF954